MTSPEVALWGALRGNRLGAKFRRQHPIGPYVVDFFCREAALVIEVDGAVHGLGDQPARDATRTAFLEENGYRVLRIGATDVLRDLEAVRRLVVSLVSAPLYQPSAGPPLRSGEE